MAEWASPGVVRCGKLLGPLGWKIWIARGESRSFGQVARVLFFVAGRAGQG